MVAATLYELLPHCMSYYHIVWDTPSFECEISECLSGGCGQCVINEEDTSSLQCMHSAQFWKLCWCVILDHVSFLLEAVALLYFHYSSV